jgi:hypothetical protein
MMEQSSTVFPRKSWPTWRHLWLSHYRADDPRVTAHIDKYFQSALEKYQDIPYNKLHEFLKELLTGWYDKYPPAAAGSKRSVCTLEDAEEGDVVNVAGTGQEGPAPAPRKQYSTQLPKRGYTTGVAPAAAAAEAAGVALAAPAPVRAAAGATAGAAERGSGSD